MISDSIMKTVKISGRSLPLMLCIDLKKKEDERNPIISMEIEIIQHLFVGLRVINFIKGYSASVGCHN